MTDDRWVVLWRQYYQGCENKPEWQVAAGTLIGFHEAVDKAERMMGAFRRKREHSIYDNGSCSGGAFVVSETTISDLAFGWTDGAGTPVWTDGPPGAVSRRGGGT